MFQDFRYSDTVRPSQSDEVLKLKNFEKDATLQLSSYQIKNVQKRQVVVGLEDFTTYWLLFNIGAAMKIKCMLKRLKKISKSFILLDVIVSNQLHKEKKSVKLMMENLFGMELELICSVLTGKSKLSMGKYSYMPTEKQEE
ncbi:hypothetical protein Tco_1214974 [Tanacetum coccineum]